MVLFLRRRKHFHLSKPSPLLWAAVAERPPNAVTIPRRLLLGFLIWVRVSFRSDFGAL
jgi:hypothetical protein